MEKQKPIVELELYLIRHGQSQGNVGYDKEDLTPQEQHDPILTEKGVKQAQLAGKHLSTVDFNRIYGVRINPYQPISTYYVNCFDFDRLKRTEEYHNKG